MKLFTNKKLIQKITIVMVFLILFNFITPNYVKAADTPLENIGEALVQGVEFLALAVGDGIITLIQKMFIGTDAVWTKEEQIESAGLMTNGAVVLNNLTSADEIGKSIKDYMFSGFSWAGIWGLNIFRTVDIVKDVQENKEKIDKYEDIYEIAISPGKIFSGVIYALNINFISATDENLSSNKSNAEVVWLNTYKDILNKIKLRADELCAKGETENLKEEEQLELEANLYVWTMAGGRLSDNEIIYKVKLWYRDMGNSFSEAQFKKVWFTDNWYNNKENKEYGDKILNIVESSGLKEAVIAAGADPNGFDSAISYAANKENSPVNVLHDIIATWYKILRNIALIVMLIVLVYIGIRIMLTSTAADNAKYKKMLIDWVVALCILFVLHYIMAFTINITQLITDAFNGSNIKQTTQDEIMNTIRKLASENTPVQFGYVILYLVLILYTVYFLFYYVKRVVYSAFLTLIAPLVAITYPLDKMGDSKSQAFDMWLKEYIMNVIIQPIHLLIYTVMVSSALSLAVNNPIYAVVVIGAMIPAEKFIKEMFGLNTKKGPMGGLLAGAAAMTAMQKLAGKKPPQFGHHQGESGKNGTDKVQEKVKKPRMADDNKKVEMSKSWMTDNDEQEKLKTVDMKKGTEGKPDIDEGEEFNLPKEYEGSGMDELSTDGLNLNGFLDTNLPKEYESSGMDELSTDGLNLDGLSDINMPEKYNGLGIDSLKSSSAKELRKLPNVSESAVKSKKTIKKPSLIRKVTKGIGKRATAWGAVNRYYKAKDIRMLKNIGKGVVKAGFGAVSAGTAATIGLAAGIATGDPGNALKYTSAGVFAGTRIGSNIGEGATNLIGGSVDFVKREKEAREIYKNEIYKNDKRYKEKQEAKVNRKEAHSFDTKTAISARFGYNSITDKKEMNNAINFVERARNNNVTDLDTILNAYGLTQGVDSEGNDINRKISEEQAMLVAMMAASGQDRKSVKSEMRLQLADNIYDNGNSGKTQEEAVLDAKKPTNDFMKMYDMVNGATVKEAGRDEVMEDLQDIKDKQKRLKQYREQEQIKEQIKAERIVKKHNN